MINIFIGPPGSGKGTQAKFIAKDFGWTHFSLGDTLREIAASNTKNAILIREYLNKGELVPVSVINNVILQVLSLENYRDKVIFDGYPRSLEQAKFLMTNLLSKDKLRVVYFDISEEVIVKRIIGRFNCTNCGYIYNKYFNATEVEGVCDCCGGKNLVHRNDDNIEILKLRIAEYHAQTLPLLDYYKNSGLVFVINASQSQDEVFKGLKIFLGL